MARRQEDGERIEGLEHRLARLEEVLAMTDLIIEIERVVDRLAAAIRARGEKT